MRLGKPAGGGWAAPRNQWTVPLSSRFCRMPSQKRRHAAGGGGQIKSGQHETEAPVASAIDSHRELSFNFQAHNCYHPTAIICLSFNFQIIMQAHESAPENSLDDVQVALGANVEVAIVAGCETNIKITLPADLKRALQIIKESTEWT